MKLVKSYFASLYQNVAIFTVSIFTNDNMFKTRKREFV